MHILPIHSEPVMQTTYDDGKYTKFDKSAAAHHITQNIILNEV